MSDEAAASERAPEHLRRGLSASEQSVVDAWWARLSTAERRSLATSVRVPRRVTVEVVGRFVDEGGETPDDAFPLDLYEYLVNHEISLSDVPTYHVCTRHEAAAAVVRAGRIPASFACPLGLSGCPMRRLLALSPGRALRLEARVRPGPLRPARPGLPRPRASAPPPAPAP